MTSRLPRDDEVVFLVCENIREEPNKKLSLLGVYTSNQILVPPDTSEVFLPALSFIFIFRGGEGSFIPSVQFTTPSGKTIAEGKVAEKVTLGEGGYNMLLNFIPFQTNEFGDFSVTAKLDDHQYHRSFAIRKSEKVVSARPASV
jgi:hypothetical protein